MKNRWTVLASAILTQTILGGIYAWSTFVPSLIKNYNLSNGQCGLIFGMSIAVFTVAMTFAGRIMVKKGPTFTATISAILFTAGYMLASFSNGNFYLLLISLSFIAGTGIGFGYVGPLTIGMKWFPKKKGLVTGVSVAGFGGGAIILSNIAKHFILMDIDILTFFRWMAYILGPILFIVAQFMINPPESKNIVHDNKWELSAILSIPFATLLIGIFSGTFSGLLIIGNIVPLLEKTGASHHMAVWSISIFAAGNALGRVIWGELFDVLGIKSIPISLAGFIVSLLLLLMHLPIMLTLFITGLLGFSFGGCFVIYASALSRQFGVDEVPTLYPIVFLGYGIAGVFGPGIGGRLADYTGSYDTAIYLSIIIVSVAFVLTIFGTRSFKKHSVNH